MRALDTLPGFEAHYGVIRLRTKVRQLADPIPGLPEYVRIIDSEEKGTDVNLATRLLVDGFNGAYEQAVIVSNDSDLASPMRYVRDELGRKVIVVNPDNNNYTHRDLVDAGDLREAVAQKPLAAQPVSAGGQRRAGAHHQAGRVVTRRGDEFSDDAEGLVLDWRISPMQGGNHGPNPHRDPRIRSRK